MHVPDTSRADCSHVPLQVLRTVQLPEVLLPGSWTVHIMNAETNLVPPNPACPRYHLTQESPQMQTQKPWLADAIFVFNCAATSDLLLPMVVFRTVRDSTVLLRRNAQGRRTIGVRVNERTLLGESRRSRQQPVAKRKVSMALTLMTMRRPHSSRCERLFFPFPGVFRQICGSGTCLRQTKTRSFRILTATLNNTGNTRRALTTLLSTAIQTNRSWGQPSPLPNPSFLALYRYVGAFQTGSVSGLQGTPNP